MGRPRPTAPIVVGWSVAALCFVAGLALGPISRATSSWLAVRVAGEFGDPVYEWCRGLGDRRHAIAPDSLRDPWGRPWRARLIGDRYSSWLEVYSTGPDGKDDAGEGDDVWFHPSMARPGPGAGVVPMGVLTSPRCFSFLAAMLLAAYTSAAWLISPRRRGSLPTEVMVASGLALPWALPALLWAKAMRDDFEGRRLVRTLEEHVIVVPFEIAAAGGIFLSAFALAFAWRLRNSRAEGGGRLSAVGQ